MKTLHEKSKNIVRWNEERDQTEDGNNKFLAGTGWLRNKLQINSLINQYRFYCKSAVYLHSISTRQQTIAVDETPVCANIALNTTVDMI